MFDGQHMCSGGRWFPNAYAYPPQNGQPHGGRSPGLEISQADALVSLQYCIDQVKSGLFITAQEDTPAKMDRMARLALVGEGDMAAHIKTAPLYKYRDSSEPIADGDTVTLDSQVAFSQFVDSEWCRQPWELHAHVADDTKTLARAFPPPLYFVAYII